MTVRELAERCGWTLLAGDGLGETPAAGCCMGDLLSWVLAHGKQGQVWLTVMGTENAIAVGALRGFSAIVLAEGAKLDPEAALWAQQQHIPVYASSQNLYDTALNVQAALACG